MRKLDFATFIQILILIATIFLAIQSFLAEDKVNFIVIIFFWTFVALVVVYSFIVWLDTRIFKRIKKIDKIEGDLLKLKETLDFRKMTEDLNTRLKIIEDKMNKKGVLSPQIVILIIIIALIIIYLLRSRG